MSLNQLLLPNTLGKKNWLNIISNDLICDSMTCNSMIMGSTQGGTFTNIDVNNANIKTLLGVTATIQGATINNLYSSNTNIINLNVQGATVNNLNVDTSIIKGLSGVTATIQEATFNKLVSTGATIDNLKTLGITTTNLYSNNIFSLGITTSNLSTNTVNINGVTVNNDAFINNRLYVANHIYTDNIDSYTNYMDFASNENITTLNMGCAQTVGNINIGVHAGIGGSTTTIKIGNEGDIILLGGTASQININNLAITNKEIFLNSGQIGTNTSTNAGLYIDDNGLTGAGYIRVKDLNCSQYELKAPSNNYSITTPLLSGNSDFVINTQDQNITGIKSFSNISVTGLTATNSTINNLVVSGLTSTNGTINNLVVSGLTSTNGTISNLTSTNGTISNLGAPTLNSTNITTSNIDTGTMKISGPLFGTTDPPKLLAWYPTLSGFNNEVGLAELSKLNVADSVVMRDTSSNINVSGVNTTNINFVGATGSTLTISQLNTSGITSSNSNITTINTKTLTADSLAFGEQASINLIQQYSSGKNTNFVAKIDTTNRDTTVLQSQILGLPSGGAISIRCGVSNKEVLNMNEVQGVSGSKAYFNDLRGLTLTTSGITTTNLYSTNIKTDGITVGLLTFDPYVADYLLKMNSQGQAVVSIQESNVATLSGNQSISGIKTFNNQIRINDSNSIDFGYNVVGKETTAGRMAYTLTSDSVDIYGAGNLSTNRKVRVYDSLNVGSVTSNTANSINTTNGIYCNSGDIIANNGQVLSRYLGSANNYAGFVAGSNSTALTAINPLNSQILLASPADLTTGGAYDFITTSSLGGLAIRHRSADLAFRTVLGFDASNNASFPNSAILSATNAVGTFNQLALSNGAGTALSSNLNIYYEQNINRTFSGGFQVAQTLACRFTRVGRQVTLQIPRTIVNASATTPAVIQCVGAVDAVFRPALVSSTITIPINTYYTNASPVNQIGYIQIAQATGTATIYFGQNFGTFGGVGGQQCGFEMINVTWSI